MAKQAEKSSAKEKKKTEVAKPEAVQPLKVEVHFPFIADLKQAIAFDSDGNLVIAIAFKAKVDQYEIFRLVNLLKQPHGALYATIGTPQSAMDFKFSKEGKVEIVKAQIAADKKGKPAAEPKPEPTAAAAKITEVRFNHIPEDDDPFGVFIEYAADGTGEMKDVAGRGKSPTEAVIAGVHACGLAVDQKEPFEIRAALEALEPTGECYKLIRVLDVGSFDAEEGNKKDTEEKPEGG